METEEKRKKVFKLPKSEKESEVNHNFGQQLNLFLKILGNFEAEGFWVYQDFIIELPGKESIPLGTAWLPRLGKCNLYTVILGFLHKIFEQNLFSGFKFDEKR